MQIKQEILDYTMELLDIHQPLSITGVYDGLVGAIAMTFNGDSNTYSQTFEYSGSETLEFRERVIQTAGILVSQHNTFMGLPSRVPFIESVTE